MVNILNSFLKTMMFMSLQFIPSFCGDEQWNIIALQHIHMNFNVCKVKKSFLYLHSIWWRIQE